MNKFYHYGDSFATCDESEQIFSKYIAEEFGLDWVDRGGSGLSNFSIISNILKDLPTLNSNDKVLIGFTFFTRGEYIDSNDNITSTNIYYNDMDGNTIDDLTHQESIGIDIMDIKRRTNTLEYLIDYSWDSYVKTFKYLTKPIIDYLINKKIDVKYFYIQKDNLNLDSNTKEFINYLPNCELSINDEYDFISFLKNKDWLKEESVHYAWNIQKQLSNEIIKNWK